MFLWKKTKLKLNITIRKASVFTFTDYKQNPIKNHATISRLVRDPTRRVIFLTLSSQDGLVQIATRDATMHIQQRIVSLVLSHLDQCK